MFEKPAQTSVPINRNIAARWSGRAFDSGRNVTPEQILALLEAARWAPSCFGDQPWRFVVCNKNTDQDAWQKAYDCLSEGNQGWARNAPLLILAIASGFLSKNNKVNRWGQYDTGAASMNLCIQATDMGLMVHQMGGFDAEKAVQAFTIPEEFTPMAMLAIGYQLPPEEISNEIRERECAERHRNPVTENFYRGSFGIPWQL